MLSKRFIFCVVHTMTNPEELRAAIHHMELELSAMLKRPPNDPTKCNLTVILDAAEQYLSILPLVSEMGDCYRIKPLEWTTNAYGDFYANSRACYKVEKTSADQIMWGYCWDEYYDEAQYECESYEEGKQKAEEQYQKRVKEFLTPTDNTTAIAKILGG